MSFAVVALMVAAASCGNCGKKASEAPAEEAAVETKACCDSCAACADSCAACADSCAACAE